jgi:hypothetical protein
VDEDPEGGEHRSLISVRATEIIVGIVLLLFGSTFMIDSYRIGAGWGIEGPKSGFFPFYVSLIIVVSSLFILLGALRMRGASGRAAFVERGQMVQVLKVLIPAAVYVLGVQLIGIYVSSVVYIIGFMRWVGRYPWWKSVLIGVVIVVAFFFMFEVWFQVPLYKGNWDLTSWTGY